MKFNIPRFIIYKTYFDSSKYLKISKKYEYLKK